MPLSKWAQLLRITILTYLICTVASKLLFWLATSNQWPVIDNFLNNKFLEFTLTTVYQKQLLQVSQLELSTMATVIGLLGALTHCILVGTCTVASLKLCKLYEQGSVFTTLHAELYKRISYIIIAYGSIGLIIMQMCHDLALSFDKGPGNRLIVAGFGTPNLEVIFWGLIAFLLSRVMYQGAVLQSEQNLTI